MLSHPLLRDDPVWMGGGMLGLGYSMSVLVVSLVYVLLLLLARKRPLMYWHCKRENMRGTVKPMSSRPAQSILFGVRTGMHNALQTILLVCICCGCTHSACTGMAENTWSTTDRVYVIRMHSMSRKEGCRRARVPCRMERRLANFRVGSWGSLLE